MFIKELLNKKYGIGLELYCALFMLYNLLAFNYIFFANIYQLSSPIFTILTFVILWIIGTMACLLLFHGKTVKPLSYLFLLINSGIFYFVKNYHVAIDEEMLRNALETNVAETLDLLNLTWLGYIALLGLIPCLVIRKLTITRRFKWYQYLLLPLIGIAFIAAVIVPNYQTVAPFVRSHKHSKYFLIPVNYIGAIISYTKHYYHENHAFKQIATDAVFKKYWQNDKQNLIIFVVGETARADKFSFNGYARDTNAPLKDHQDNIINYPNTVSCGTSTAVSLPCMFSKDSRENYSGGMAYTENVLDVLQRNGYNVAWVENNSDCKNVCNRIKTLYPCGIHPQERECTDKVMIPEIAKAMPITPQNTLIVLHQVGSHGPKYFKRYPAQFEQYKPVCNTEKLNECTQEELINTYDNTIYYTSQNIADIIEEAQKYKDNYNITVIYASDHGESLGENGLYLHSAPYIIAPDEQKQIPFFIWAESETLQELNLDKECLINMAKHPVSHDNIFHSLLGLSGIITKEYKQRLDLFAKCKK